MKSDKKLEEILAALRAARPALKEMDAAKLTDNILSGIVNKKQAGNTGGKLLSMARIVSTAAAVILLSFLLYQQLAEGGDHQSNAMGNPYYKTAVRDHSRLPQTKSIDDLLDYYIQYKKEKSPIASFRERYNHIPGK
ncbi:hypothetical protein [Chitinophaga sp. XS-30]|uniref:hypothetical protein n=1 Tax=Chitinophaga sp. XS-30 TaxID=2604421 RepID=UPI0011DC8629|nr:hypothetical protein [Chitinophaga sp. XS-30]QEH40488.1 hypothetical protein FW415_06215 [Chitinophaga sp. XS-30]